MVIDDPQVLLAAIETEEVHREPRWLLGITLLFLVGVTVLLIFYAQLPTFVSGFVR